MVIKGSKASMDPNTSTLPLDILQILFDYSICVVSPWKLKWLCKDFIAIYNKYMCSLDKRQEYVVCNVDVITGLLNVVNSEPKNKEALIELMYRMYVTYIPWRANATVSILDVRKHFLPSFYKRKCAKKIAGCVTSQKYCEDDLDEIMKTKGHIVADRRRYRIRYNESDMLLDLGVERLGAEVFESLKYTKEADRLTDVYTSHQGSCYLHPTARYYMFHSLLRKPEGLYEIRGADVFALIVRGPADHLPEHAPEWKTEYTLTTLYLLSMYERDANCLSKLLNKMQSLFTCARVMYKDTVLFPTNSNVILGSADDITLDTHSVYEHAYVISRLTTLAKIPDILCSVRSTLRSESFWASDINSQVLDKDKGVMYIHVPSNVILSLQDKSYIDKLQQVLDSLVSTLKRGGVKYTITDVASNEKRSILNMCLDYGYSIFGTAYTVSVCRGWGISLAECIKRSGSRMTICNEGTFHASSTKTRQLSGLSGKILIDLDLASHLYRAYYNEFVVQDYYINTEKYSTFCSRRTKVASAVTDEEFMCKLVDYMEDCLLSPVYNRKFMGPGVPGNIFEYNSPITAKIHIEALKRINNKK